MSEIETKQGYCYACDTENVPLSFSGSGRNPICMECGEELDKYYAETEWNPTDKELDEMYERIAKPHAERMMKELESEADKKFNILKHDLGSIFS